VAFDRRGHYDFISHQMGSRCCSEDFAASMSVALNAAGRGLDYLPDDGGSYTDSYSYAGQISECANVSVGYAGEHGPKETLDALHVWRLREAILRADFGQVPCTRDPSTFEDDWLSMYGSYGSSAGMSNGSRTGNRAWYGSTVAYQSSLVDLIKRYPAAAADLLRQYGLGTDELLEHLTDRELGEALADGTHGGGWAND
jgi:hypothetical protein